MEHLRKCLKGPEMIQIKQSKLDEDKRNNALKKMYCDNSTNYRFAETELQRNLLELDGMID
jgi:hypothetical protein